MYCKAYYRAVRAILQGSLIFMKEPKYKIKYAREQPLLMLPIKEANDVSNIRHTIDTLLTTKTGWKNPARSRILLAVSEAVTNVVRHTPGGQILVYLDEVGPRFHIIDRGPGFDRRSLPVFLFVEGFSKGNTLGFGFSIIIKYTKQMVISTSSGGTKLVLTFDLVELGDKLYHKRG